MIQRRNSGGFTIIELMLALAFISMLLLAIVMTAIQAGRMYSYGATLRSINQAGRDISDMLRRDFIQTDQRQVVRNGDGDVVMGLKDGGSLRSGRVCLGQYSYLWNVPEVLDDSLTGQAVVVDHEGQPINFVRVVDSGGGLCRPDASGRYINQLTDPSRVTHLLKRQADGREVVLAMHQLQVSSVAGASDSSDSLFGITMVIGTSRLDEINTSDQSCRPPSDDQSNIDFCSINQFDMIVRTNG